MYGEGESEGEGLWSWYTTILFSFYNLLLLFFRLWEQSELLSLQAWAKYSHSLPLFVCVFFHLFPHTGRQTAALSSSQTCGCKQEPAGGADSDCIRLRCTPLWRELCELGTLLPLTSIKGFPVLLQVQELTSKARELKVPFLLLVANLFHFQYYVVINRRV